MMPHRRMKRTNRRAARGLFEALEERVLITGVTTIRLMVLYSSDLAGPGIDAGIASAVDSVNQVMDNSLVPVHIELVHAQMENYVSSGDYNKDLDRLESASDGFMDDMPALRSQWGADLVSLLVNT